MSVLAVPLGEIVTFIRGVTFDKAQEDSKASDENLPLLRAGNIGRQLDLTCDLIYLPRSIVSKEQLLQKGDIVICLSSGSPKVVGKTAVFKGDSNFSIGAFCGIIRPRDILDSDYLTLWFRSAKFTDWRDEQARGANIQNLRFSELAKLKITLPEKPDQRRIVAQLCARLSAVEEARRAAEAQAKEADFLVRRILEEVLAALNEAERIPLGELLSGIEAGKSIQTSERLAQDDELGVLRVSAVSWTEFNPQEAKAVDTFYNPHERHYVKAGDLLISRANTVELVGAVVRVDRDYPNRLLSDKTLRLLIDENKITPDYLLQILRMPEARAHIEGNATGTSNSMRNISQDTIRAVPIPLPSLVVQQRVARRLNEIDAALKQIKEAVAASLKDLELLPSRLLSQAFGEA